MICADYGYEGTMKFYNEHEEFNAEETTLQTSLQVKSLYDQARMWMNELESDERESEHVQCFVSIVKYIRNLSKEEGKLTLRD